MAANRQEDKHNLEFAPSHDAPPTKVQIKEAVVELSLSAIMLSDLEGNITDINPAFLRLWGYDRRAEILGRRLSDLVFDHAQADDLMQRSTFRAPCRGQLIIVRKNGTLRVAEFEARLLSDPAGDAPCLAASFLDITERAEARHSLRASEARYRNIVNAVPVGIAMTDPEGAVTFYSAQAREMFALADDQVALGTHCLDWIAPGQVEERLPLCQSTPPPDPLELRLLRADGTEFWAEVAVVTLDEDRTRDGAKDGESASDKESAEDGEVERGHLVVVRNISDRKRAEDALSDYARDLERSNQELEQFAYVASHDLQEPLRMVAAYVQLLAKDYQGHFSAEADDYIAFAVDGAKRMQRLIDDLLAYSRVGTQRQAFQPFDCAEVLSEVLSNLRLAIDECGATITWGPLPSVRGDRGQVFQLLQNLIGNALKFRTAAAPVIHIQACPLSPPLPRSYAKQTIWQFSVSDNGIGIEPQYSERIFVIFQRLNSRSHYSGTGIGLAICKKIVERHGGRIWVESAMNQGATFHFTLPGDPGATPTAQAIPYA